jgi:hypothetical protein
MKQLQEEVIKYINSLHYRLIKNIEEDLYLNHCESNFVKII